MNEKKCIGFFSVIFILLFSMAPIYGTATEITAPNGVLMDFETGKVLYEKNAYEPTYPASTTKVMTAILVLEKANLEDVVTIDYDLHVDGSGMYLVKGESFTVKELFQGLLVRSANDAAEALAIHIAGSVEEFAKLMNERAKELGTLNTNFTNPHGLPDENHVTTAYDLAIISKHAMEFPFFRETVSTTMITFDETEQTPEKRYYRNSNRLLWGTGGGNLMDYRGETINIKYDIVDGIKTGYTNAAQQCLIASALNNDQRLISVVLGATGSNIYIDTRTLIDYGYENFTIHGMTEANEFQSEAPVKNGVLDSVKLKTADSLSVVLNKDQDPSLITKEVIINENITAPIEEGAVLGKVIYSLGDEILGEVNLIAEAFVDLAPSLFNFSGFGKYILIIFILFIVWQIFVAYIRFQRKRKRYIYGGYSKNSYQFSKNMLKRR